jgi:hypothetical protein
MQSLRTGRGPEGENWLRGEVVVPELKTKGVRRLLYTYVREGKRFLGKGRGRRGR